MGPGRPFPVPSAAFAAAHDDDTIQVDAAGDYANDVALIDRDRLTVVGVGASRAVMRTDGRTFGRKGIWVFAEGRVGLTLRHLEFSGATVADVDGANGAGLRSLGRGLTVSDCRFHHNQNGILGCYGTTTIEASEFDHNGATGLTHNLYVGDPDGTLTFRYNYSHDTALGHLLKSRAAVNRIEYNRLTDEAGTGSYELDLPNGGDCQLVGNLIQQSAGSGNGTILCYGEEGITSPRSTLTLVANTVVNDGPAGGVFVNAQGLPAGFRLVATNNLFAGPGEAFHLSSGRPTVGGNVAVPTVAAAGFADAARFDYRPTRASPAVAAAVPVTPVATSEYVHPRSSRPRPAGVPVDVGALQHDW